MKKTDIAMIILISSISMITAFFVTRNFFGDVYSGSATVKTIDRIDSTIVKPDSSIFNKDAINPTVPANIKSTDSTADSSSTSSGTQ